MFTDETDPSIGKGPNGLASCNIFNNEISLECKCSPKNEKLIRNSAAEKSEYLRPQPTLQSRTDAGPPVIVAEKAIETNPSVSESRYEVVKKPSAPGRKVKKGRLPGVDIFHERASSKSVLLNSASKFISKPLKPASFMANKKSVVDTDEMDLLFAKYLGTEHETVIVDDPQIVATIPDQSSTGKQNKMALFFQAKSKKKAEKEKDCLNDNILTKEAYSSSTYTPVFNKARFKEMSLRFFRKKSDPTPIQPEELIIAQTESAIPLEKNDSDPTVASGDSNSLIDRVAAPDDTTTHDDTTMDISVFQVFEQYTGGTFPTHHCSPRLPRNQFEINKQAELLSQIEALQKELSESKGTVQELTQELDEVYSEKDIAINKLDQLIEYSMLNDTNDAEYEMLREIRMYLTDRTEPTTSSITTTESYHCPSDGYAPFYLCFRSKI